MLWQESISRREQPTLKLSRRTQKANQEAIHDLVGGHIHGHLPCPSLCHSPSPGIPDGCQTVTLHHEDEMRSTLTKPIILKPSDACQNKTQHT